MTDYLVKSERGEYIHMLPNIISKKIAWMFYIDNRIYDVFGAFQVPQKTIVIVPNKISNQFLFYLSALAMLAK